MSQIRADNITNRQGTGAPIFVNGIRVVGLTSIANIVANTGTFSGAVSIGGTLTYEDVTNVDAVGLITARSGIKVTTGGIEVAAGDVVIPDKIVHAGDTDTAIRFSGANQISAETGGSERLRIDSTGILKLYGDGGNNSVIYGHRAGGLSYILGNQSGSDDFNIKTWASSTNIIFSLAGNNEKLRIGPAGQIGLSGANYGTSGQVMTSQGASAAPQWATVAAGMTEIDEWYLSGDSGVGPDADGPWWSSNVVRSTKANFSVKGTGMTFGTSDGVWTFPSTGYWEVTNHMNGRAFHPSNTRYINHYWMFTTNNSTYNIIFTQTLNGETAPNTNGAYLGFNWSKTHIFRITDASNQKMKQGFMHNYGGGWGLLGAAQTSSTGNGNGACNWIFKKLADV